MPGEADKYSRKRKRAARRGDEVAAGGKAPGRAPLVWCRRCGYIALAPPQRVRLPGTALTDPIPTGPNQPEIERIFDTTLIGADAAGSILEQARELLMFRNLQSLDQMSTLKENSAQLEARTNDQLRKAYP